MSLAGLLLVFVGFVYSHSEKYGKPARRPADAPSDGAGFVVAIVTILLLTAIAAIVRR